MSWASLTCLPRFEDLSADQRAVLQLLLQRGQSYDQIAGALKSEPGTVRTRAAGALTALGDSGHAASLSEEELGLLTDDILGQGTADGASDLLDHSAAARGWQRSVGHALTAAGLLDASRPSSAPPTLSAGGDDIAGDPSGAPISRTGGAILLGLVAAGLVLVVLWVAGVFDGGSPQSAKTSTTTRTTGPTSGLEITNQVNLKAPDGSASPKGAAFFAQQDGQRGLQVIGQGLQPSSFYALWVQTDGRWRRLGFVPPVRPDGDAKGRLEVLVPDLPADVLTADRMVISRERTKDPKAPNAIVLSGPIKAG